MLWQDIWTVFWRDWVVLHRRLKNLFLAVWWLLCYIW